MRSTIKTTANKRKIISLSCTAVCVDLQQYVSRDVRLFALCFIELTVACFNEKNDEKKTNVQGDASPAGLERLDPRPASLDVSGGGARFSKMPI